MQTSAQPNAGSALPAPPDAIDLLCEQLSKAIAAKAARDAGLLGGSIILKATGPLSWQAADNYCHGTDDQDRLIESYRGPYTTRYDGALYQCHSTRLDAAGREWTRFYLAYADDFGHLVEVKRA